MGKGAAPGHLVLSGGFLWPLPSSCLGPEFHTPFFPGSVSFVLSQHRNLGDSKVSLRGSDIECHRSANKEKSKIKMDLIDSSPIPLPPRAGSSCRATWKVEAPTSEF